MTNCWAYTRVLDSDEREEMETKANIESLLCLRFNTLRLNHIVVIIDRSVNRMIVEYWPFFNAWLQLLLAYTTHDLLPHARNHHSFSLSHALSFALSHPNFLLSFVCVFDCTKHCYHRLNQKEKWNSETDEKSIIKKSKNFLWCTTNDSI